MHLYRLCSFLWIKVYVQRGICYISSSFNSRTLLVLETQQAVAFIGPKSRASSQIVPGLLVARNLWWCGHWTAEFRSGALGILLEPSSGVWTVRKEMGLTL